jgi:uncharacterized membrane protein YesL
MNILDSKVYRSLDVFANLLLLNVLWLISCIPLVTAFPATAAMFGVVREWIRDGDYTVLGPFAKHFKANFAQSLLIGVLWLVFGLVLIADFLVIGGIQSELKLLLFGVQALVAFLFLSTSVYLFPLMVNYELGWRGLIRNAFLIAVSQLGTTFACLMIVLLAVVAVLYLQATILVVGSVTAYFIYTLCHRAFLRIEALKDGAQ